MISAGRSFNEVTDYVKKVEGVRRDDQAKALAKRAKNSGNFQGSYSRGSGRPSLVAKPIQSAMPASTGNYSRTPSYNFQDSQGVAPSMGDILYFDRTFYNCGELGHMRRDCPYPRVLDVAQQPSRAMVPTENDSNGRGRPQGGRRGNQRDRGDCAAEDRSATIVEITDELGDPPFGHLFAFSVLPLASSHSGSLGDTVLLRGTDRRLADCSFPRLLIHFLQGFAYWNEGRFMSFWRLAKLNSAIRKIPFLVLFSPICSILRLSVHASTKTSNT
uniref:'chromo' domain containing protein n=1 Tax=Solanum tuberosum TaxID=4113 RepID=M1DSW0_SOLTU